MSTFLDALFRQNSDQLQNQQDTRGRVTLLLDEFQPSPPVLRGLGASNGTRPLDEVLLNL